MLFSTILVAQTDLEKLESKEGVESVVVSKKMFDLMSKVKVDANNKEAQQYLNLLKKIDNLQAYYTSSVKLGVDINSAVSSYLKSHQLDLMSTSTEEGNLIKVYGKADEKSEHVKEVLVVVNGNYNGIKTSVLSISGDFPLADIAQLVKKFNIPMPDIFKK